MDLEAAIEAEREQRARRAGQVATLTTVVVLTASIVKTWQRCLRTRLDNCSVRPLPLVVAVSILLQAPEISEALPTSLSQSSVESSVAWLRTSWFQSNP